MNDPANNTPVMNKKAARKARQAAKAAEAAATPAPVVVTPAKTPVTPAVKASAMNEVDRAKAINVLYAELATKPASNRQKAIRRNLRALGHRGGLRTSVAGA